MVDVRPWTAAALVGTLWGALELSVGTVLHLSRIPLRGLVMVALGLICLTTLRRLRGRPGVIVTAGIVAAFLKVFTLGGLYPGPLIGILLEALVVEIVFDVAGTHRISAVLSGAIVSALTPIQMTVMIWLVAGRETLGATASAVSASMAQLGIAGVPPMLALGAVVVACALVGAGVGGWAWKLSSGVMGRLES